MPPCCSVDVLGVNAPGYNRSLFHHGRGGGVGLSLGIGVPLGVGVGRGVGVGVPGFPCPDEKIIWLTIILWRGMVAVVMHR